MLTGIDHVVVAVADPDEAAARLGRALGVAAAPGGRHDAFGTVNRLLWFGDTFVELIGVADRERALRSWIGRPAVRALDAGGGFATWALASDAIDDDVAALRRGGSELHEPLPGERRRPDGGLVRWRYAAPPALGPGEPPFLLEHDTSAAEWSAIDRAVRAAGPGRIEILELGVANVHLGAMVLLRAVGLRFRPSLGGGGARDANAGGQLVRLRRVSGAPTATVHIAMPGRPQPVVDLLGCRWVVSG